jgi:dipeptidase E
MVMTPRIGPEFVNWDRSPGDETLGLVDFSIFPHLDYPGWPDNSLDSARRWAEKIGGSAYAIDDQTAISVVGGSVQVLSEGHWEQFTAE